MNIQAKPPIKRPGGKHATDDTVANDKPSADTVVALFIPLVAHLDDDERRYAVSLLIDKLFPDSGKPTTTFKKVLTEISRRKLREFNRAATAKHRSSVLKKPHVGGGGQKRTSTRLSNG